MSFIVIIGTLSLPIFSLENRLLNMDKNQWTRSRKEELTNSKRRLGTHARINNAPKKWRDKNGYSTGKTEKCGRDKVTGLNRLHSSGATICQLECAKETAPADGDD